MERYPNDFSSVKIKLDSTIFLYLKLLDLKINYVNLIGQYCCSLMGI